MIITVELSLYPLVSDYESDIINCIQGLKEQEKIDVYTNALSTQVKGEWSDVFSALDSVLSNTMDSDRTMSVVIKIINKDCAIEHGHLSV